MTEDRDNKRRARRAATRQWSRNPAGTTYVAVEPGSPEFFAQMTATRYELQPWHRDLLRAASLTGRVLEVGCGAGTDHSVLGETARVMIGVDLAYEGAWLTTKRTLLEHRAGGASVADGESLPFGAGTFDAVYSFGVIHHTDHPERVVEEIHRVLRPGGRFVIALYHRWSLFALMHAYGWFRTGRRESWQAHLGLIEAGAADLDERPIVRLYSRRGCRRLFRQFAGVKTTLRHFGIAHPSARHIPPSIQDRIGRIAGWYVIISGVRPGT